MVHFFTYFIEQKLQISIKKLTKLKNSKIDLKINKIFKTYEKTHLACGASLARVGDPDVRNANSAAFA